MRNPDKTESMTSSITNPNQQERLSTGRLLLLAASFGVITGLIEGLGLLAFHGFPWFVLNSRIPEGVSIEILWVSPIVNLCVFLLIGLILAALRGIFSGFPTLRVALFLFSFMAVVDWTGVTGRIGPIAIIVLAAGFGTVVSTRLYAKSASLLHSAPGVLKWGIVATAIIFVAVEGGTRLREQLATNHLPAASKSSPNVLVILVDTLRADHLSTYGYSRPTSPHLDSIAKQGVLFENAVSTSSWTLPAHESLLTGRYPHEHGPLREQPLNPNYPTLAQVLDARGYRTAAISANTDFFNRRAGFDRGFLHFEDYFYSATDAFYRTFWGRLVCHDYFAELLGMDELPPRRKAADVNGGLLRWIDRDRDHPFFAFINYFDIHHPYVPEQPYRDKFASRQQEAACAPTLTQLLNPFDRGTEFEQLLRLSPACFQLEIDKYDGGISYVDDQIASLFSQLAQRGLDKNTLVIITSDHGESFREHGLVTHGTALYRELISVPLIYWWPGHIPAGIRIARPISSTASLPATILELLGDGNQTDFPVPSLALLWNQPGANPDWPYPLSEMAQDLFIPPQDPAYKGWLKSITDPQWHLIVSQAAPEELYRYPQDPAETQNQADTSEGKAVMNREETQLWNQVSPDQRHKAGLTDQPNETKIAGIAK
jgi:arylsulfatase A-like enzyme